MPLEIVWPTPTTPPVHFGPGSLFHIQQTDIGPIPNDDSIEVQIRNEFETIMFAWMVRLANGVNSWNGLWVTRPQQFVGQGWSTLLEERPVAVEGQQLRLFAQQKHADGTIIGTISMPITYSPTVTAWVPNAFPIQANIPAGVQPQLDRIEDAVYQRFPRG